jgi:predicted HicB family RNase H-like nuclease
VNQLRYKNYIGSVFFSEEDGVFHGKVIGISDSISFEGDSVKGLTEDFHNAIDEYLEFCTDVGKEPEISMHSVTISPEIFNLAMIYASLKGLPMNEFIEEILESNIRA